MRLLKQDAFKFNISPHLPALQNLSTWWQHISIVRQSGNSLSDVIFLVTTTSISHVYMLVIIQYTLPIYVETVLEIVMVLQLVQNKYEKLKRLIRCM